MNKGLELGSGNCHRMLHLTRTIKNQNILVIACLVQKMQQCKVRGWPIGGVVSTNIVCPV